MDYKCTRCGATLEPTGKVLFSFPAQYEYQCPICKEKFYFTKEEDKQAMIDKNLNRANEDYSSDLMKSNVSSETLNS